MYAVDTIFYYFVTFFNNVIKLKLINDNVLNSYLTYIYIYLLMAPPKIIVIDTTGCNPSKIKKLYLYLCKELRIWLRHNATNQKVAG
jgi:hypothetical protein